jgi:aryl-alcohol dehydrogenase-like predicted oxidoreductase
MQTRTIGNGLSLSTIGLGCMGMSQGYGPVDEAGSLATLRAAIDLGVTYWDTAQSYGAGDNERLLARALTGVRDKVKISSKFGIVRGPAGVRLDGRPERVKGYAEASLERLATDYIDLYYLHRVDPEVPIEETIGAMANLVVEGKVLHLGISECDPGQLQRAAAVHPIAALQCEWSLWWREGENDVIPMARRLGIGLVPYSPLGRGFLAGTALPETFSQGDFRYGDARFIGSAREGNLTVVNAYGRLAAEFGMTCAQLALAWLLAQGDDVVPIPGTRRVERLTENAAAAAKILSPDDLSRIEQVAGRAHWSGDRRSFAAHNTQRQKPAPRIA